MTSLDTLLRSFRDLSRAAWPPGTDLLCVTRADHPALAVVLQQLIDRLGYPYRGADGPRRQVHDSTYAYYLTDRTIARVTFRAPSGREIPPTREGPDDRRPTHAVLDRPR